MVVIVWENAAQKAAGMAALAKRITPMHAIDWAETVGEIGERSFRETVEMGGVIRTKKGGPRIDTGAMIGSVDNIVTSTGSGAQVKSGFLDGRPPWTRYQEGGTSRGVPPMLAVPQARMEMSLAAKSEGDHMLTKIQGEWNAI